MIRLLGPGVRLCDGCNRREVVRIGGLGVLGAGLSLTDLLARSAGQQLVGPLRRSVGRNRASCSS